MTVQDGTELAELLARATEVEAAALEAKADEVEPAPLTPDAVQDLALQAVQPEVKELAAAVAELTERLEVLAASSVPGVDPQADFDAADEPEDPGMDFDEPDDEPAAEGKAVDWAACADCGSTGRDEFKGGTAACEDCGSPLTPLEAKDALEDELDGVLHVIEQPDPPADAEVKADTVTLSELELLQARREALEQ